MEVRILKEMEFWKNWNFCGCEGRKRIREKGKRKRNEKREDIFSNLESENIGNTGSRVKVEYAGKHFGKYRNRPKFKYFGSTRKFYQKSRIIYEDS